MRVRGCDVLQVGFDRPGCGGEEHFAFIGAADAAHVRHAEALHRGLVIVIAESVGFRIRAQLNHAERHDSAGIDIFAVARPLAGAYKWIDGRLGSGCR
jgi:hypothetical protein